MARPIKRLPSEETPSLDPAQAANQYLQYRKLREQVEKQENGVKKALMAELDERGEEDDKGNKFFHFEPGTVEGLEAVKRERRLSQSLDTEAAMALITELALEETCLEVVTETVINEDAILAANFKGTITDEQLAQLYQSKETFAFVLVKEK